MGSTKGGFFYTSSDGAEWSLPTLPDPLNNINSLAWSGSVVVAVGDSGSVYTSSNGTDWTSRTSGVSVELTKVEWLNNQLVAVGENGTVLFSSDGITWDVQSTSTTDYLIDITWNGTLYVVASSLNYFTSTDGVNWSGATSTGGLVEDIAWSGTLGLFASVDTNGRITTSNDGSAWVDHPRDSLRVLRGGAWSIAADLCRTAFRNRSVPDDRDDYIGFRLVCLPDQHGEPS